MAKSVSTILSERRAERRWVAMVKARDGFRCMFERLTPSGLWLPHFVREPRMDACHIINRNECGVAKFTEVVGICGCEVCHKIYDRNTIGPPPYQVRVPLDRYEAAYKAVCFVSKVPPRRRIGQIA